MGTSSKHTDALLTITYAWKKHVCVCMPQFRNSDGVKKLTHMTFFVEKMCCFQPMRVFQKNVYAFITNTSSKKPAYAPDKTTHWRKIWCLRGFRSNGGVKKLTQTTLFRERLCCFQPIRGFQKNECVHWHTLMMFMSATSRGFGRIRHF